MKTDPVTPVYTTLWSYCALNTLYSDLSLSLSRCHTIMSVYFLYYFDCTPIIYYFYSVQRRCPCSMVSGSIVIETVICSVCLCVRRSVYSLLCSCGLCCLLTIMTATYALMHNEL